MMNVVDDFCHLHLCFFFLCPQVAVTQTQLLSSLANDYAWFKKDKCLVHRETHQGCRRCVLCGLVLRRLYPGLQVSRWMEVLALVSAAAAFDVVHADDDRVLAAVHHAGLHGVSIAAVALAPRAVTALEFSTNLAESWGALISLLLFIIPRLNIATWQLHAGCIPPACLCARVFARRCRLPWLPGQWDSQGPEGEYWAAAQALSPCPGPCGSDRD